MRGGARPPLVLGVCGGRAFSYPGSFLGLVGLRWGWEEPAYGPSWTFLTSSCPPLLGTLSKCFRVVSVCVFGKESYRGVTQW